MIYYLVKVSIYQGAFVLFYLVFLRNLTHFRVNRIFLLSGLIFSFVLPVLTIGPVNDTMIRGEVSHLINAETAAVYSWWVRTKPVLESGYSRMEILKFLYMGGCLFLVFRFVANLFKLNTISRKYELIESSNGIRVFRTPGSQPFSFFNNVFVPADLIGSADFVKILDHEREHAKQLHSCDRILVDFIILLLWINPFTHLAKKLLIELHEFEADAAVVEKSKEKLLYQRTILTIASRPSIPGLVSFFNHSTLKRRINMMNIKKSSKRSLVQLLLLVPVVAGISVIFSFNLNRALTENLNKPTAGLAMIQLVDYNPVPAILPVKSDSLKFRITSAFGPRKDPITKKQRFHNGIDIYAAKGTPIVASADGTVFEVDYQPNGYGNYVVIKHGEEYMTKYAQMDSYVVQVGDVLKQGDILGYVGSSGKSTGPHLHYEVHKDGKPVDPAGYIKDFEPK